MPMKIAIIGAGAAGLCVLRHALASPSTFSAVAFEMSDKVGGTWVYTDKTGRDEYGYPVHSSMYKSLRTNIPKEVMNFPDFPFRDDLPSFVRHDDVLEYLENYAAHFALYEHIKFRTAVENVQPIQDVEDSEKVRWRVTTRTVTEPSGTSSDIFDGVVVCCGHYSKPLIPNLKGLERFKGNIMHSHDYRSPEQFTGSRIVVLGAAASGQDISVELSRVAEKLYLSHNKAQLQTVLPGNMEQVTGIEEVYESSVKLLGGKEIKCDAILLCTGYHFSFPFLGSECKVEVKDERITPLYKHLVHTIYPSMFFIGMCKIICPFPQFHVQSQFCLKVLDGTLQLPNREEMDEDTRKDYNNRMKQGLPRRHAHLMGPRQWEYNKVLSEMAGVEPIPPNVQALYNHVHAIRCKQLTTYKQLKFRLTGPDSFETMMPENRLQQQSEPVTCCE